MCKEDNDIQYDDGVRSGAVLVEDTHYYQNNNRMLPWVGVNFIKIHALISEYEPPYVCLLGQSIEADKPTQSIVLSLHTALQLRDWLNDNLEGPEGFIEQAASLGTLSEKQLQSLFPLLSDKEKERSSNIQSKCHE